MMKKRPFLEGTFLIGRRDAVYYLHGDHLGSVSMTTNASGEIESQMRFTPFGEELTWEGSGSSPTDFSFTGQRAERGFGLSDYNARFYSSYLNHFIQPDSIVPNLFNTGDLDRYAYSANNPIRYNDPSGHHYCDSQYAAEEACDWYNKAPLPDEVCQKDRACYQAYLTYNEMIFQLGRIPTSAEILYMTAQAEGYSAKGEDYHGSGTFEEHFVEGLARNYWEPYQACESGSSTCSASYLYKFMSGYQPWWDGSKTPSERAEYLLGKMEMDIYRSDLESVVEDILDPRIAGAPENRWTDGMWAGKGWQWHNWSRAPKSGEALGWIILPNIYGDYFWIMSADQTDYFQDCIKNPNPTADKCKK